MSSVHDETIKLISSNPIAKTDFLWVEVVEAGLMLTGTEIKSLRTQSPNLRDSFIEVSMTPKKSEAWLVNCHIAPYSHGNIWNHEPRRRRKLLLHAHQIKRLHGGIIKDGMTIVPTRIYLKKGIAKIEIALAKGKKNHDKRQDSKKKSAQKEMAQALSKKNSRES